MDLIDLFTTVPKFISQKDEKKVKKILPHLHKNSKGFNALSKYMHIFF